jgi:hypothetical protein
MAQDISQRSLILIGAVCILMFVAGLLFVLKILIILPVLLLVLFALSKATKTRQQTIITFGGILFVGGFMSLIASKVVVPDQIRNELSHSTNSLTAVESLQAAQGFYEVLGYSLGALGLILLLAGLLQTKTSR